MNLFRWMISLIRPSFVEAFLAPELLFGGGAAAAGAGAAGAAGAGLSMSDLAALGMATNGVSGLIGADAAGRAANAQANAANNAANTNLQMFNTINSQQAPYRQSGSTALSQLSAFAGLPGYETGMSVNGPNAPQDNTFYGYGTRPFTSSDLNANLAPNWEFALKQGQGAASNALNLTGGMGGNFGKGLVDYTLNKSGDLYQQAYNNYNTNQNNIFNRLSSIAGIGQASNQQSATAGTNLAGNIGNAQIAQGAAQAAGTVGTANALTGAANNALGWYALPSLMNANA